MTTVVGAPQLANLLGEWAGDGVLPDSLATSIAQLIDSGLIAAGSLLPPQRRLGEALGVSRGTVASAYGRLEAEGYLIARQGSGCRVRSRGRHRLASDGRMFSFTQAELQDLSSGALPASHVARAVLQETRGDVLGPYLETDGYFPAGLPVLRSAIADRLTRDGIPTSPREILVTSGAQQGTWLSFLSTLTAGDLVLVEEPTYRGALSALAAVGARVEGVRLSADGIDADLVGRGAARGATLLYCQTSVHNPTGISHTASARAALADVAVRTGMTVVEDCCSHDLTLHGRPTAPTLAALVPPSQLVLVGTLSKLFWGGLRVGWIRADRDRIRGLVQLRKATDLAVGVLNQLQATTLLGVAEEARIERRAFLGSALATTEDLVRSAFPSWQWRPVRGGPGLWIETGQDTVALTEAGKRAGIKLAPGPSFSVYEGFRTHLRLPVWHERAPMEHALQTLAALRV
ncbi:PLP-dependent aminotransferase family protein [Propionicicella superfundia]|uniref:aminotransferase-like domain-containing protein n=1 Tax=Propionicicella superfundia TaxID=348582 RepID=UPI00040188CF|nr:PLP-dependent aminotransferase family protein [Propionicicella superfundia]